MIIRLVIKATVPGSVREVWALERKAASWTRCYPT